MKYSCHNVFLLLRVKSLSILILMPDVTFHKYIFTPLPFIISIFIQSMAWNGNGSLSSLPETPSAIMVHHYMIILMMINIVSCTLILTKLYPVLGVGSNQSRYALSCPVLAPPLASCHQRYIPCKTNTINNY